MRGVAAASARWELRPEPDPGRVDALVGDLAIPRIGAGLLVQRGLDDPRAARSFLCPSLTGLGDPMGLLGMDEAVRRIESALGAGEKIVVHGDYDVDGVSGTAILVSYLRRRGADVHAFLPDRVRDGYGLSARLIRRAAEVGVSLMITVDCGSTDHEGLDLARETGLDVVVTDHHQMSSRFEHDAILINPKREGETYPFLDLSGAGLAFKLAQALSAGEPGGGAGVEDLVDLAALGTLADIVPVGGENRILAWAGMKRIEERSRPGLARLLDLAGVAAGRRIRSFHMAFVLSPRLNAAGRVEKPGAALELLLCEDEQEAGRLAGRLERANRRRKEMDGLATEQATTQAEALLEAGPPNSLVVASSDWHEGIIGIVAARLVQAFRLPAIVIGIRDGVGKGSCRGVPGLDMVGALARCSRHLIRFGGHGAAAGFSIEPGSIDAFRESFAEAVEVLLPAEQRTFVRTADRSLGLGACDLELARFLETLEPFGPGNPQPAFACRDLVTVPETVRMVGRNHLKATFQDPDGGKLECIGFGFGDRLSPADLGAGRWDALFELSRQEGWDPDAVQGRLLELRPAARGSGA